MKLTDLIFEEVSMIDVLNKYHHTGKHRRSNCPIHNGKDNNFCYTEKVYHCWSCGASGNVASFVMDLFGLSFVDACIKINCDFNLNIPIYEKLTYRQKQKARIKLKNIRTKRELEKNKKQEEEDNYDELINEYIKWDKIRTLYAPKTPKLPLNELYVTAMHKLPYIEYRMDIEDWRISDELKQGGSSGGK